MVIYVFLKNIFLSSLQIDTFLSQVDPIKANMLRSHINKPGIQMRLLADIALRRLLCQHLNCKNESLVFGTNQYGKPLLIQPTSNMHFNLSHSGNYILIGIGDHELGVDVQKLLHPKSKERIVQRCFTSNEKQFLLSSTEQALAFTKIWCIKEAFLKAIGTGIRRPLTDVDTCDENGLRPQISDWYIQTGTLTDLDQVYIYATALKTLVLERNIISKSLSSICYNSKSFVNF